MTRRAAAVGDVEAELALSNDPNAATLPTQGQQATTRTSEDVSPIQIAAADQLSASHTLGRNDLFRTTTERPPS